MKSQDNLNLLNNNPEKFFADESMFSLPNSGSTLLQPLVLFRCLVGAL